MANSEPVPGSKQQTKGKRPVPAEHGERIRRLVEAKGLYQAADLLGCSKDTVTKALAGLALTPGSRALLAAAIEQRTRDGKNP